MKTVRPILLLSAALITGCSSPKWLGYSVGFQHVEQFKRGPSADSVSGYGIGLWQIAPRTTFHLQNIHPINGSPPLLGVGVDFRIF